ncbi:MAG: tetratricopeptide repeat protein [Thermodesulfobacteriota bacterium]
MKSPTKGTRLSEREKDAIVSLGICLLAFLVFRACLHFDFISLDDSVYLADNPFLRKGVTLSGLSWAFSARVGALWMPVTWLSYLADFSLYGLDPGPYHAVNLALHCATAALLFLALKNATGKRAVSAFIAAAFAVHPLRIESVVWIAERKDVLFSFFFLAGLLAWIRHIRRPGASRYLWALLLFVLSAGAKPMAVTFPCVLLLLDYWPLGRMAGARKGYLFRDAPGAEAGKTPFRLLLLEKLPFFLVAVLVGIVTIRFQSASAMIPLEELSLGKRIINAGWAYVHYLSMILWPSGLAVFYPLKTHPPASLAFSWCVLLSFTSLAIGIRKKFPYVPVGWLWYLGMLFPVIGILQAGDQAIADRFTYLPSIGVFLIAGFGAADLPFPGKIPGTLRKGMLLGLGILVIAALTLASLRQVSFWRDSETLYRRTVAVTEKNIRILVLLGRDLATRAKYQEARAVLLQAVKFDPGVQEARTDLGRLEEDAGFPEKAERWYREQVVVHPEGAYGLYYLGSFLLRSGHPEEAAEWLEKAARALPGDIQAENALGAALFLSGKIKEAKQHLEKAVALFPDSGEAHLNLGLVYQKEGNLPQAFAYLQKAAELDPALSAKAYGSMGDLLSEKGRYKEALVLYERARDLNPKNARLMNNMGIALARTDKAAEAEQAFRLALALDPGLSDAKNNLATLKMHDR